MKILIVTQRYWPENFTITNIAEELVKLGNDVTVLTGLPNYPDGFIFPGYENGKNRNQNHNGVKIVRVKEIERRHDIVHRFLNYYSYPHFAKKALKQMNCAFDVVFVNELSPIMCALPAIAYKKKNNVKVLMYEMDLWPESLLAGGVKKGGLIYNYYKKVSGKIYSQMDKILVSTEEHIDYIKALPGCDHLDISYLPQYAESYFRPKKSLQSEKKVTDFMFAGNMGKAQNLDLIIEAAELIKDRHDIFFHMVGSGSAKSSAEELAKRLGLENVIFHGRIAKEKMPEMYEIADVMIVTLTNAEYARMTIPGKLQTYMASGKPILSAAIGATNSLVEQTRSGIVVNDLTPKSFANACLSFADNPELIEECGINSYKTYEERFSKAKFLDNLMLYLHLLQF